MRRHAFERRRVVRLRGALTPANRSRRGRTTAAPLSLHVLGPGGAVPVAQLTGDLRVGIPAWGDVGAHENRPYALAGRFASSHRHRASTAGTGPSSPDS